MSAWKVAAVSVLVALLACATLWAQVRANGKLTAEKAALTQQVSHQNALIAKERAEALASALRAGHYQDQRRKSHDEITKLERCIADKSCVPRVRVYTSCPTVPGATTGATGTTLATAELGPDDQRLVIQLREAAKLVNDRYLWLQSELVARSDPNYCKPR